MHVAQMLLDYQSRGLETHAKRAAVDIATVEEEIRALEAKQAKSAAARLAAQQDAVKEAVKRLNRVALGSAGTDDGFLLADIGDHEFIADIADQQAGVALLLNDYAGDKARMIPPAYYLNRKFGEGDYDKLPIPQVSAGGMGALSPDHTWSLPGYCRGLVDR